MLMCIGFQALYRKWSYGIRLGRRAGHEGCLMFQFPEMLHNVAIKLFLYGQLHHIAGRTCILSPHHLNKKNNAVIFKCIVLNITVFEKKISSIIFVALIVCHTQTLSWNNTLCVILGCILISIWYFEYLYRCLGKTMSHMQNKLALTITHHFHRSSYKSVPLEHSEFLCHCKCLYSCTKTAL